MKDQYEQYSNLPKLLKRFSFDAKMAIATTCSTEAMSFGERVRKDPQNTGVFPWILETFVMLSMESQEYADGNFTGKNKNKFQKICKAIWDGTAEVKKDKCGRFSFVDVILPLVGLSQFSFQQCDSIRQYRYWSLFNDLNEKLNMKTVFREKMGAEYNDYLLLGNMLQVLLYTNASKISQQILKYLLMERFKHITKYLSISRETYIQMQRKLAGDSENKYRYIYSLCPSHQFPFVEEKGKIYLPLPHLLNESITSSLYYRITDDDVELLSRIGKYGWERYLVNLVKEADVYNEVFPEQRYLYKKSEAFSPDVLAREGKEVLFIDSKSTTPKVSIRWPAAEAFETNIRIVAENIVKLHRQMHRFTLYNPFKESVSDSQEDYWGIVIVLEDAYILRERYYEKACEKLRINKGSYEWEWLIKHIKVMSLYEVERISLSKSSLVVAFKECFKDDPFDLYFADYPKERDHFAAADYLKFKEEREKQLMSLLDEMHIRDLI